MDKALLRQRQEFVQRAEASHTTYDAEGAKKKRKQPGQPKTKQVSKSARKVVDDNASLTNMAHFATMAKIVDYMKKRHLDNQQWGLSLKEILDEIQAYDLTKRSEQWLQAALPKNPKLALDKEGKFIYVPPFKIKGKASLIAVLVKHHREGRGGILLSQISECIPDADKVCQSAANEVTLINTSVYKRKDKVVFWKDPGYDIPLDEEYKQIWRSVTMDHLDEKKIEEYLQKKGIQTTKDLTPKVVPKIVKKKPGKRKVTKTYNEHISDILVEFDDKQ